MELALCLPQIPNWHVPDPARCSGGEHGVRRTGPRCHLPPQDATAARAPHLLLRRGAPGGGVTLRLILDDDKGNLMTLDMLTVSQDQASRLAERFREQPERLYQKILQLLLEEAP